ncbi:MAG: tagaturonate epimerase family protein [Rubripirellula sp.]
MKSIERFSFGVGDRFAHQAKAQLRAFQMLSEHGVSVAPVWNKSNREHSFVGSEPQSVFDAAKVAIDEMGWTDPWYVDADHIQLATVDGYLGCSDFFTIDVADSIGKEASADELDDFMNRHPELVGTLAIEGLDEPMVIQADDVRSVASKYLLAVKEAGEIYRHIASSKGEDGFVAEVSMDETDAPQTPPELLVILAALADQGIRIQTIAPKFTGRFNKGVDYVGDLVQFEKEFNDDLAVIAHAIKTYGLPANLKLSVHSGSDKFSLYPIIRRALARTGAGVHLKTAGTTWLEEIIGLAEAGGDGLELAKEIYTYSYEHVDELCAPYASVIDIDRSQLPDVATVTAWSGDQMANAIRHIPDHPEFNSSVRQLLHVSFKVAAKAGSRYTDLLVKHQEIVSAEVTKNIFERHLRPLFLG